jgi:hypothetical protein
LFKNSFCDPEAILRRAVWTAVRKKLTAKTGSTTEIS